MDVPDPLIGARLGEYQVVERIGEGGMGVVYRGFQPVIKKRVAIKVLHPELATRPDLARRMLEEARAASAVGHRGIVDIFGSGEIPDGRHYLVMEYLEGQPLDLKLADHGAFFPQEAIPLLKEICSALAAAHARGIVHRDLKPSNVFVVTPPDGARFAKLLDFGLTWPSEVLSEVEEPGAIRIVRSLGYMAPEQIRAEPVTPRTDLYALGALAFELLTGQLPFRAPSLGEVLQGHLEALRASLTTPTPPPSSLVDGLPAALDALVLHLLAKDPERRPASADEVHAALTSIEREVVQAPTQRVSAAVGTESAGATTIPSDAVLARRSRWIQVATSAAVVVAGALVGALAVRACLPGGR